MFTMNQIGYGWMELLIENNPIIITQTGHQMNQTIGTAMNIVQK